MAHTPKTAIAPPIPGALGKLIVWTDARFPLVKLYKEQLTDYYAPKNFIFCTTSARSQCWCW